MRFFLSKSDVIKRATDLWQRDKDAWADNYRKAKDDLHFLSDEDDAQWDGRDLQRRRETGRPALTVDQLGQFIHQVGNDIRMNTPTINVIPDGEGASQDVAEFYKGKIKAIEYNSNADTAYDTAAMSAIKCGIGFLRVDHDYANDEGFEQELCIKRVINPFSCYIDANSTEADGSDAKHGFVIDEISVAEFKRRYPNKEVSSFGDEEGTERKEDEKVCVAEFFEIEETDHEIEAPDGKTKRTAKKRRVRRYTLSGKEALEETTFPGKYIPIVPVYGEEAWRDGKRYLHSLIRRSKDSQRLYNLMASVELETLMKQPQAPVMAAAGSIENYAEDWRDPTKAAVLRFDMVDVNGNQLPPPQRLEPPTISAGMINARRGAVDDIKATMGIYNAALGQTSNETSGKAINARKLEGDVATYHFGDNLVKSITQLGRILVFAIPEIHDTPRITQVVDQEDEPQLVGINGEVADGQEQTIDLSQGRYSVRVTTGASFTTQRQETVAALTEMFSANPQMMQMFGDIYFKNSDFAGAQAMAKRAEKLLPPNLKEDGEDAEKIQMQQALEQAGQQIQALTTQLQDKQASEQGKNQLELMKLQMEAQQHQAENELERQKLALEAQKLEIERLKVTESIEAQRLQAQRPAEIGQSGPIN